MSILSDLHKNSIRVSDIASQYWCERQMEFNYRYGPKITQQIKEGREIHAELEDEVKIPIILQPKNYADALYKNLYTSYVAVNALQENKKTREVQVYGSIGGYSVVGKIDQLEKKDGEVIISEDKTRANHNIPSESQTLTHRVQLMVYKKLVDDIIGGEYTAQNFARGNHTNTLRLTEEFIRQLDALDIQKSLQNLETVASAFLSSIASLKKVSDTLHIRYINQFSGKEIKLYKFDYNKDEMDGIIRYILKYWSGERKAAPVPENESWKCSYCVFFGKECKEWWPQKVL